MNKLVILVLALPLVFVSASGRAATGSGGGEPVSVTRGWAGYVVRSAGRSFGDVRGSWVQPAVGCNRPGSAAAFSVGLGGTTGRFTSARADRHVGGVLRARAPFLLSLVSAVPRASGRAAFDSSPWADAIAAEVVVSGERVAFALRNVPRRAPRFRISSGLDRPRQIRSNGSWKRRPPVSRPACRVSAGRLRARRLFRIVDEPRRPSGHGQGRSLVAAQTRTGEGATQSSCSSVALARWIIV